MELKEKLSETACVPSEHGQLQHQERKEVLVLILPLCSRCSTEFLQNESEWQFLFDLLISTAVLIRSGLQTSSCFPLAQEPVERRFNIRAEAAVQRQSDIRAPSIRNRLQGFVSKISNPLLRKRRVRRIRSANIQTSPNVGITTQFHVKSTFLLNGETVSEHPFRRI